MNRREKIIFITIASVVGVAILYWVVNWLIFSPFTGLDSRKAARQDEIRKLAAANAKRKDYERTISSMTARSLGSDDSEVGEKVRSRLAGLLAASGLTSERWKLMPLTDANLPSGAKDKRVGWSINARGPLEQVVTFLYLLESEPYIHKLENLKLTPRAGELTLDVNFLTLALERRKDAPPATMPETQPATVDDARQQYALVYGRDIFRPYIPKVKPPPVVAVAPPPGAVPPPAPTDNPEARIRVVSLSAWPEPEVGVNDNGNFLSLKVGERIGENARIMAVDYRELPYNEGPLTLYSQSRVIVRMNREFFAIERGKTLAERRRMPNELLPPGLQRPASGPATAPVAAAAAATQPKNPPAAPGAAG
jgi:hypothetical protein